VGPGDNIFLPPQSQQVDLEVELAIVIGALTRNVSPEDALQYVWGFTVANDVTARDLQASDDQWARSKSFDSFCPLGPWLETEFIPEDQMIESRINGEVVQSSTIDQMIFTVPQIISYISHNMTLLPGDVIITGTPAGITKINSGDIIECEVEGVGTLINQVA
jgi:2-keto-4-pentenoate hydratase/2-oxohepta-3-ene-1,7-dioic acid hydratase in catechol pathway